MTDWPQSFEEARRIQEKLAPQIKVAGNPSGVKHIAGVDMSTVRGSSKAWASVVVIHLGSMETVELAHATSEMTFPYVPGYLSFREGPVIEKAINKVKTKVDLWFFDGQGIAHPRRFGLASHMGLLLNQPSVGVAKKKYIGVHRPVGDKKGRMETLFDEGEEPIGVVLRTRPRVEPVYVSPGHLVSIQAAGQWALRVTGKLRIPEPTRRAHMAVNRYRKGNIPK